jgi:prolyl 4-hydroxylase
MSKANVSKEGGAKKGDVAKGKAENVTPKSTSGRALFFNVVIVLAAFAAGIFSRRFPAVFRGNDVSLLNGRGLSTAPASYLRCNDESLSQYLNDIAVPGLHVVCWQDETLTFYEDAHVGAPTASVPASNLQNWKDLRSRLVQHLSLQSSDELHQPWATFTPVGDRSLSEVDSDDASIDMLQGLFLVFQGGQWIWPGVRKGFRREIRLSDGRNATLQTISIHPLVLSVEGFLAMDECKMIQETATPSLRYSEVTLMDHDQGRPASDFRTSQTTFLFSSMHPSLKEIDERTASLVRVPVSHQEQVQVLRYGNGEKYDTHHDYFDPSLYQKDPSTLQLIGNGLRNRMITVFWYLSDVEQGGETAFPLFDGKVISADTYCDADSGSLKVKPQAGKVIIFYSQTPSGLVDPNSLHGACPVKEGTKWAANKWVWNAPMPYMDY